MGALYTTVCQLVFFKIVRGKGERGNVLCSYLAQDGTTSKVCLWHWGSWGRNPWVQVTPGDTAGEAVPPTQLCHPKGRSFPLPLPGGVLKSKEAVHGFLRPFVGQKSYF